MNTTTVTCTECPCNVLAGRYVEVIVGSCDEAGTSGAAFGDVERVDYTDFELACAAGEAARAVGKSVIIRPRFNEGTTPYSYREWRSINGVDFEEIWWRHEVGAHDTLTALPPNRDKDAPVEFTYWDCPGKKGGIVFHAYFAQEIFAANDAVESVMKKAGLRIFHQVGYREDPGMSAWEQWSGKPREYIEALLPEVRAMYAVKLAERKERHAPKELTKADIIDVCYYVGRAGTSSLRGVRGK